MRFAKALAVLLALAGLAFPAQVFAQSFQALSPFGEKLFEEFAASLPAFSEEAALAGASERFHVAKKGDQVSFFFEGRAISGAFLGLANGMVLVDGQRIPLGELSEDLAAKFDEAKAKERKEDFLRKQREFYRLERLRKLESGRASLMLKYPAIDERRLDAAFSKIETRARSFALMEETAKLYSGLLPSKKPSMDLLDACVAEVVKKHADLQYDGTFAQSKQAVEEAKAKEREASEKKAARLAARELAPKVATPEFEPDGGQFDPTQPIKISCPTPGAAIYYALDGAEPNEFSKLYAEPFRLKQAAQIRAVAVHRDMNDSETASNAPWTGLGLYASYFDRLGFSGGTSARIDPELDFDWISSSPEPAIPADFFSAIWAGSLCAPDSADYTLYILADGGVRLWLDGRLLVDSWTDAPLKERSAKVRLEAGRPANVKIAFCECSSMPRIRFDWSAPLLRRRPVPSSCLSAKGGYADELLRWNERQGGAYVNRKSMPNPGAVDGSPLFKGMPDGLGLEKTVR